jgi:hypothetical protein
VKVIFWRLIFISRSFKLLTRLSTAKDLLFVEKYLAISRHLGSANVKMSAVGLDLSSLLTLRLQLNDEHQRQQSLLTNFDIHAGFAMSDQTSLTSRLLAPPTVTSVAGARCDRLLPLGSTLSLPESCTPAALLANFDEDDETCLSLDAAGRTAMKTNDRRTCSLGDALGQGRHGGAQQQQQSSTRYKTELCRPFEEHGTCRYGNKCQFAHGRAELRVVSRHPKYKTDLCRTFHSTGLCPYGRRCHFVHNEEERGMEILPDQPLTSAEAQNAIRQGQLLQHRLSIAAAAENPDVAGHRRVMHQFSQQLSVFENDGDELTQGRPAAVQTQWGVPSTSVNRHQPLARRISVADPLHHIQQQQQQQQQMRTDRMQSLGLISPPGFESFTSSSLSSLVLPELGAAAPRSIGSAAESSISSTASSVDGGSRSPSPALGLFALPESQIWQQPQQQQVWGTTTAVNAAPASAQLRPSTAAAGLPPSEADALQEVWARLLSHLPAEKIVEMILATMKQQPSTATSSPDLSPPTSEASWPQLPLFPSIPPPATGNAAVW